VKNVAFIPCEDIRQEVNGKVSLMGVVEGISFTHGPGQTWPVQIRLAAQLRFELEASEPVPNEAGFSLTFNGKEVANGIGPIAIARRELPIALGVPMVIVLIDGPGTLTYTFAFRSQDEHEWAPLVFNVSVELQQAPTFQFQ
jgi:hypothetical protein